MREAILKRDPDLIATSHPDVPAGMDRVLRRALARDPDDRYPSLDGGTLRRGCCLARVHAKYVH
jgi:hypothetical protein